MVGRLMFLVDTNIWLVHKVATKGAQIRVASLESSAAVGAEGGRRGEQRNEHIRSEVPPKAANGGSERVTCSDDPDLELRNL
jgi:hypothetical protein